MKWREYNPEWQALRQVIIARAGGMCERCKARKGHHVHHLVYGGRKRGTEPFEWLQFVCLQCHTHYHPGKTFRSVAEQRAIAKARKEQRRKAGRKRKRPPCAHCGNQWPREKHERLCVRFGLTKRKD